MKIFVDPELEKYSVPKDQSSYDRLEADCCSNGILCDLLVDERGAVLDGMHRFKIAEKHGLDFGHKVNKDFATLEAKQDWICCQALETKKFTKQQLMIVRFRLMDHREGSLEDRATELARSMATDAKDIQRLQGRFVEAYRYGRLITDNAIYPGIYQYVWQGGAMLRRDLDQLKKMSKTMQRDALKIRMETSKPWTRCIDDTCPYSGDEIEDMMRRNVHEAQKFVAQARRVVQSFLDNDCVTQNRTAEAFVGHCSLFERGAGEMLEALST